MVASRTPRIGFLIGSPQDYHQLLPLMTALPASERTIVLRGGLAPAAALARREAIAARLQALDQRVARASTMTEVPWDQIDALVCASESTANSDHLLNAAFVATARSRGLPTFQLQHGIVPLKDFVPPVVWFSEHYLAWGEDVRKQLARPATRSPKGARPPAATIFHPLETMRYVVTGCPKFDAYAPSQAAPVQATDLFGAAASGFGRTILVATNLHWAQHGRDHGVWPAIRALVEQSPDDLFILKLHPAEEAPPELLAAPRRNLIVLDELESLRCGLDSARLVRASDAVICTLSTIALEAALAGRPFLVLETGNPNRYHGVRPIPPADLARAVPALLQRRSRVTAFIDHYVDRTRIGSATPHVLRTVRRAAIQARTRPARSPRAGATVGLRAVEAMATLFVERDAHAAALAQAAEHKDAYAAELLARIAQLSAAGLQKDEWLARARERIQALEQAVVRGSVMEAASGGQR